MKAISTMKKARYLLVMLFVGTSFICSNVLANQTFQPVFNPTLEVSKSSFKIEIDGRLDDDGWINASRASNFVERSPGDNTQPEVKTEVLVTFDDEYLYVAFNCFDDPSSIRATMCQRDQFYGNDQVVLLLDTFADASWAYELTVNPYGVQRDELWSSVAGGDAGFDMIWESAAQVTEFGYQVEIAVPFASLRFPNKDVQSWKMDFWRNRPRESYQTYSWAANDRNEQCWPCKWGTVNGISNVQPGKGFEILPTAIATQSSSRSSLPAPQFGLDPNSPLSSDDINTEISVGGKYSLSSNVILEGSYNPDFSQIESDAAQIDVNTTIALFYPERRPFFQEGRDIFRTIFNSFYTRTVNDPQFATKLTGRLDGVSIGFLSALDENTPYIIPLEERSILENTGESLVNVLRASKAFGENNNVGFIVTDRRFIDGGGYGTTFGIDGSYRISQNYSVIGQYVSSLTEEPDDSSYAQGFEGVLFDNDEHTVALDGEKYSGDAFIAQFRRNGRHLYFTADYNQVEAAYRTQTGYDPWNNYRNASFYTGYTFYFENSIFERVTPQVYTERRWNFDSVQKWAHTNYSIQSRLKYAQTYLSIGSHQGEERWGDTEFTSLWDVYINNYSRLNDKMGWGINISRGVDVARWLGTKGNSTELSFSLDLKPIDRITIEPNYNFEKLTDKETGEEIYSGFITRTRIQYQANRELSVRFVVQYNDFSEKWEFDPLITYRLGSFSVFYLGTTHDINKFEIEPDNKTKWLESKRQIFVKLQYLFRT